MLKLLLIGASFLISRALLIAQPYEISLDSCLKWFGNHYPIYSQLQLQKKTEETQLASLSKSWYPQFSITGQASYQSDVTAIEIPLPNIPLPDPLSKDQYKFFTEISQLVYDGSSVKRQKNAFRVQSQMDYVKNEIEFYKAEGRIIALYFSALLLNAQEKINRYTLSDLDEQIAKLKAAVEAGAALESSLFALEAEKISLEQRTEETSIKLQQVRQSLSLMTGKTFSAQIQFLEPPLPTLNTQMVRKELEWSNLFSQNAEMQWKLKQSQSLPKILFFGQAGYSNPALNFLKKGFNSYYIAGLRLQWNLSPFYTYSNDKEILRLGKSMAVLQKDLFLLNLQQSIDEQVLEIERLKKLMVSDDFLLNYRKKITETARAQLEEGILTSADYIRELNNEEKAKVNAKFHSLQFIQAHYTLNYFNGHTN